MDYSKICRICLVDLSKMKTIVPLYKETYTSKCVDKVMSSMIMYACSIEIEDIMLLPSHICILCYQDLTKFHDFKKKSQESDTKLKVLLKPSAGVCKIKQELEECVIDIGEEDNSEKLEHYEETLPEISSHAINEQNCSFGFEQNNQEHLVIPADDSQECDKQECAHVDKMDVVKEETPDIPSSPRIVVKALSDLKEMHKQPSDEDDTPLSDIISKQSNNRGQLLLSCAFCEQQFKSKSAIKMHEREHEKLYKCAICYETCPTLAKLQKHRAQVHRKTPYCCVFCSITFSDVTSWSQHLSVKHVACSHCNSYFKGRDDFKSHSCMTRFKSKPQLKKSIKSYPVMVTRGETKQQLFSCFLCHQDFLDKGSLICHQAVMHRGKPIDNTHRPPKISVIFCPDCLKFFRNVADMQAHTCASKRVSPYKRSKPSVECTAFIKQDMDITHTGQNHKAINYPLLCTETFNYSDLIVEDTSREAQQCTFRVKQEPC